MNEKAERINGWAAMLGIIAAIGAYVTTGQLIQEYSDVGLRINVDRSVHILGSIYD